MNKLLKVVRQTRRYLKDLSDKHMDDTATELSLSDLLAEFEHTWNQAREDRWLTDFETEQLCRLWLALKDRHQRSLIYNREVQHELDKLRNRLRLALSADDRKRDPALGQTTIGEYLQSGDWPEAA